MKIDERDEIMFTIRLKELIKQKGITKKQFCEEIQINKNLPKYWEDNHTIPNRTILNAISKYFNVSVDYLLGKTDIKEQKEKTPSNDEDVKVALFGGDSEVTDEMWNEVKQYAEFIKSKYNKS